MPKYQVNTSRVRYHIFVVEAPNEEQAKLYITDYMNDRESIRLECSIISEILDNDNDFEIGVGPYQGE